MNATYPEAPGFKETDTETSREAAAAVDGKAGTLRDKCAGLLKVSELTADEIAFRLGESVLSVRPRISELKASGRLAATGKRRKNESGASAVVWRWASPAEQTKLDL